MFLNPVAWLAKQIAKEIIMDARMQKMIDDVAATKTIAASVEAAFPILGQQITDLKQQIADLQAQIAGGAGVTSADLDALAASAADLEQTNAGLQAAVPANTSG